MTTAIRREWHGVSRGDEYRVVPLGDVHLGNRACDEDRLKRVVDRIGGDPRCYWIGMGDYCDFINVSDKRFNPDSLAGWVRMGDLGDLAKAQSKRFLGIVKPIANRCLALIEGNHERAIRRHYERDIYSEIVTGIKEAGGFEADDHLALGVTGWLMLLFHRDKATTTVRISLHHGFVGGKLAGAKALNLQRWLWSHECDLAIFGHSHNTEAQPEAVEWVDRRGNVRLRKRMGCYGGTFLGAADYALEKGLFPIPLAGVEVIIRPGRADRNRVGDWLQVLVE